MAVRENETIVRGSHENDLNGVLLVRADSRLAFACCCSRIDLFVKHWNLRVEDHVR